MFKRIFLIAIATGLAGCGDPYGLDFGPNSIKSELGQTAAAYLICRKGAAARSAAGISEPAPCTAYRQLLAGIPDNNVPDVGDARENQLIAEARHQALR